MILLPEAALCGIVAMVAFGLANVLAQPVIAQVGEVHTVLYRNIIIAAALACVAPWVVNPSLLNTAAVMQAALVGVLGYVPLYFFFRAIGVGKMGVVVPIANADSVIAVLIGVWFLQEPMSVQRVIAIVCVVGGLTTMTVDPADWRRSDLLSRRSGAPYAVLAMLGWGMFFPLMQMPARRIGVFATSLVVEGTIMLMALSHVLLKRQRLELPVGRTNRTFMVASALCGAVASVAISAGLARGYVSVVSPIVAASPVVTTLLAYKLFGERLSRRQYLAGALTVAGVTWLAQV